MGLTSYSKNMIYLFTGDIASRLVGFIAITYIARILETSSFGIIHIGLAILTYATIIGNSGLTYLGTRNIAGKPETIPEITSRILITRMILSSAAYLAAVVFIHFFLNSEEVKSVTMIYLLYLFPVALILDWYFQGYRQMGIISTGKFIGMLFYLIFILILVRSAGDILNVAWGWVVGGIANALFLWVVFKFKNYKLCFKYSHLKIKSLLLEAFPLGIATLISQVIIQFPVIYLGWFATTSDAGIFSAAFRVTVLLLIFDRVFYTMFFPVVSRFALQYPERLAEIFNLTLKIITISALTIGLAAILSADYAILTVFGEKFSAAAPVFQILVGYFVLTLIISVFSYTLVGMKRDRTLTRAMFIGMGTFFISIFILPRFFNIIGVAGALTIYELTALTVMASDIKKQLSVNLSKILLLPLLVASLIFLPSLLIINIMLPVKLLMTIVIGVPLLAWLGGIKLDEIRYIKKSLI
jgi:O-antigen/teichoic acid export membrane protein